MHKHRIEIESRSALLIEEELALARRKRSEKARLEALRLDEEAAIALAKAKAIEDEFQLSGASVHSQTPSLPNLPQVNPKERVQKYLDSHEEPFCLSHDKICIRSKNTILKTSLGQRLNKNQTQGRKSHFTASSTQTPHPLRLHPIQFKQPWVPTLSLWPVESLYRKKLEKFDDRPENYHTWRGSFENMIAGVKISPSEQLSLIIEYTTNESK